MEEVDNILIHALKQVGTTCTFTLTHEHIRFVLGRDVGEEVGSIKQFSSELLVEAVVTCVRLIHPSLGASLPAALPPGMSARFRVGVSLAQACQDLGYKGEIGYQTFLYSNEPEIRSLLMFLVEKLPRERSEKLDQPTGKLEVLQRAVAAAIRAQLSAPWLPPNCRLPLQAPGMLQRYHAQTLSLPHGSKGPAEQQLKDVQEYQRSFLRPVTAQLSSQSSAVASVLEQHSAELSAAQQWESEWNSQGLLSRLTPQEYRSRKQTRLHKRIEEQLRSAVLPPSERASTSDLSEVLQSLRGSAPSDGLLLKGTHFTHTQKFSFTRDQAAASPVAMASPVSMASPAGAQPESDGQLHQQVLTSLQQQVQQLDADVHHLTQDMKRMGVAYTQMSNELKQRRLENSEKEEKTEVKKKTIHLLPDADNNLVQLQLVVESSVKRVVNLASQWEKHRAPLIQEHRRLKEMCSHQDLESSRKLSEIKSLHEKIRVCTEEAKEKEDVYKQLVTELDSLPQDASRSAYTQRILEIVSNIRKQKEEITKILMDTKHLQKDINALTGKLDRTFAVTDEMVFKDAKKDESVRKSYKYLAALHENCNQLIQTIEDTGTILREIRDLEEQIETENGNKTVANLERILEDYRAVRQENSALAARVREA